MPDTIVENESLDYESQRLLAIELGNAEQLDVHRWSEYPEVDQAVDSIYTELCANPAFVGNRKLRKRHIKVIILDLYVKWLKDPEMYSSYYRAKWYYDDLESRYNKLHISKLTPKIVDALVANDYVSHVNGYYGRTGGASHISRMRATDKLIQLIVDEHHVTPEMVELAPDTECIIMRNYDERRKRQVDSDYSDDEDSRIARWRVDLCAYNNLLRRTFIDVPSCPADGIPTRSDAGRRIRISQHEKFVYRIFSNGDWNQGGRFYGGWWQRMPSEWRRRIRIGMTPVTEIDYSGLHIVILYALKGVSYLDDPYQLEGYEQSERMRMLLKQILLASINADNKSTAVKAVRKETNFDPSYEWFRNSEVDLSRIVEDFVSKHHRIGDAFFSNSGVRLQNLDSRIAEKIINRFTQQNVPVLCVHDSFIVQADKAEELKEAMETAFREALREFGAPIDHLPRTSLDGLGLGQWTVILSRPEWGDVRESLSRERYEYPEWFARHEAFRQRDLSEPYYLSATIDG